MIIGSILAGLIGLLTWLIRIKIWPDNVPENVSKFRWLIAFAITLLAATLQIAMKIEVVGIIYILNGVLLISIAHVLENKPNKKFIKEDIEYACSECNSQVGESDKFCPNCGAVLSEQVTE